MLSDTELVTYRRDGIVVPSWRLPADALARMRAALDRLSAANPGRTGDVMLCPHLGHDAAQEIAGVTPVVGDPEWMGFATRPEILDMVAQILGPDLILWGTTVFGKPAAAGQETPWHQDGEYWPIRPRATCSVWIALDDATPENGCLRVIPGSHRDRRLLGHHRATRHDLTLHLELNDDEYDPATARDVVLEAGQMSLHDVYLVHGSNANRSAKRRAGFVLRLMPATSRYDHALGRDMARHSPGNADLGRRAIFLVRGTDRCGANDFKISHAENRHPEPITT